MTKKAKGPGTPTTPDRQALVIRLPADLHKQLAEEKERSSFSMNDIVMMALRDWLARRKPS